MSGADIARRIMAATRQPIAAALGGEARRAADLLAASAPGSSAATAPHDRGTMVTLTGPGLFAREFGALDSASDPVIAPAISRMGVYRKKGRPT
ncbi:hypothetical protein SAMN02745157_0567 [Kaistia soli DSM 19436]|uniref:Uncharacterized protein n=1 Tax=Kaistia soli DSM 19436 TaxID=1122133 RepID=A0A1M4UYU6_9HYPH|nr:hypothetical protein [Kaistia soli]SHE61820.1 hypothetical protein SAMN02745157_0567 [Kaistia soli DSM 19436]